MKKKSSIFSIFQVAAVCFISMIVVADASATEKDRISPQIQILLLGEKAADFGDLDDATFPTRRKSSNCLPGRSGPYHLNVSHEWIGMGLSSTTDKELDARVIDKDFDDGIVNIYAVNSCGPGCTIGQVSVSVGRDSDSAIRYLNVAADLNHDGQFSFYPAAGKFQHEWLLINLPIMTTSRQSMVGGVFRIVDPLVLTQTPCVRITLTTEMIDPLSFGITGWDGSGPAGGFARGETEDICPQNPTDPFPVKSWTTGTGVKFPVYTVDPPAVPFPLPHGPFVDAPGGPPVVDIPPPPEKKDIHSYPPPATVEEEDASKPFAAPPVTAKPDPFLYRAVIDTPKMADNKQSEENDCMPTAAANSIEYLLNRAGVSSGLSHADLKGIMSPEGDPPDGMMDAPGGTGTTVPGFRRGKRLASGALASHGKAIKTDTTLEPSFLNIYNAVNEGKDVEIAISYEDSDPPEGHAVIVTGVTMDHNGNMTMTFVDPGNEAAGEQTYTVTNGAGRSDPQAINNGGLRVDDFPGAGDKVAVIKHLFVEELVDAPPAD